MTREHEVQVLNRSSGGAFAKIIENRGQQDVPVLHVMKYAQVHVVRTVQHLRVQVFQGARFVQRQDSYVSYLGIVACEACVQRGAIHAGRQQPQRQRHRQHDALAERSIRGDENGTLRKPGVLLNLRRVLVREFQAIDLV
ncbi:hypothetical protein A33K_17336 [Burkholderia humptydooensis MSMB43]|uniref:Uncharacterized protein n=1 Tax=Burkholderia humptydooensis MSMB43 TaxID=441157 RepID=A0ABN0G1Z7_9BURK|nr:hypothetical protein A33K_17336 [Burkholderia humptydooensis MSMB43]